MLLRRTYSVFVLRGLFTLTLVCSIVNCFPQANSSINSDKIRLEILVTSDNKEKPDSTIVIVKGFEDSSAYISMTSNHFIVPLNYNDKYVVTVTKRNCNTKVLYLDTNCPVSNWDLKADVNLTSKNRSVVRAGMLKYNADLQTFVRYAVK